MTLAALQLPGEMGSLLELVLSSGCRGPVMKVAADAKKQPLLITSFILETGVGRQSWELQNIFSESRSEQGLT